MIKNNALFCTAVAIYIFTSSDFLFAQSKKKDALPKVTSSEIWIDRFDASSEKSILGTYWFIFTDNATEGKSRISPNDIKEAYQTTSSGNNTGSLKFNYTLDKGNYKWDPYVGIGISIVDSNVSVGLDNIKGVAYKYKGNRHTLSYCLNSVSDYAHYQRVVPESENWKTIIIPISELRQPSWGKKVEFNLSLIKALQWTISGKTGDTGTLCIDNIRLLRKLPKAENIVEPEKKSVAETATIPTRTISDKVKIADWYGFSKAAYSLSFDDGLVSQYTYAAPILDKHNLKATFYIITERLQSDSTRPSSWHYGYWYQFIRLCKKGHELGSHSATHPKLTELPDGDSNDPNTLQYELKTPIKTLEKEFPGYKFITFAYPYVNYNEHVMEETAKLYYSSRAHGNGFNAVHPAQWMNIQAHSLEYNSERSLESDSLKMTTLENWITDNTIAKGGWTVYYAHDVLPFVQASTAKDSWQPVSSESFELFAKWLEEKQKLKLLWVETVGNVTRYIKERDAVNIVLVEETKDKLSFRITDNLPDELFNYPVTLEITLPEGWQKAEAKQKNIKNTFVVYNKKIQVNVVPDQGIFEIRRVE